MKKIQIGVMGSAADLKYSSALESIAEEIGQQVAKNNAILFFGAEKDYDSLSTAACRGAKKAGGITVGVTYGKKQAVFEDADILIASGMERGGGREMNLVLSCDAIIAINGGSGTLTEMVIAYQSNIPIIVVANTGGWSNRMAGQYFDARERLMVLPANNAKEAVLLAIKEIKKVYCKEE